LPNSLQSSFLSQVAEKLSQAVETATFQKFLLKPVSFSSAKDLKSDHQGLLSHHWCMLLQELAARVDQKKRSEASDPLLMHSLLNADLPVLEEDQKSQQKVLAQLIIRIAQQLQRFLARNKKIKKDRMPLQTLVIVYNLLLYRFFKTHRNRDSFIRKNQFLLKGLLLYLI
jgi:hypothetical protein